MALAIAATLLARIVPLAGAPVIAIVLGVVAGAAFRAPLWQPGFADAGRRWLQAGIVVTGLTLPLLDVLRTGVATLPLILITIAIALALAVPLGRALGVARDVRDLVAAGTAICGASAIAAVSSVIDADAAAVAVSIATVFFYNVIAVVVFPPLGHGMGMTQPQFGTWAGTAINDTSSVVAAGYAFGAAAGAHATIVKLTRAAMILPLAAGWAAWRARERAAAGERIAWRSIVPWFIVWFLVAALCEPLVPAAWHAAITALGVFGITVALAAIGLRTNVATLVRTGARPLALGLLLWLAVALSSLAVQRATGS